MELIEKAVGANATALLEQAEELRIIEIEVGRIRFAHPLLSAGVYGAAPAARRRAMHRRLAAVVEAPEERARHLAHGALRADRETVRALDKAALQTRARGAPAAAAELLELALRLGAEEPGRRVQRAEYLLDAGDSGRAHRLLEDVIPELQSGPIRGEALFLLGSIHSHGHSCVEAAALLERALRDGSNDRRIRAQVSVGLTVVLVDLGRVADAERYAEAALCEAEQLGDEGLLAQALAYLVGCTLLQGHGLDEARLERAIALEDPNRRITILRPTVPASARGAAEDALTLIEQTNFVHATFWAAGTLGFLISPSEPPTPRRAGSVL